MTGTISRLTLVAQRYKFVTLANGIEVAFETVITPVGSVNGTFLSRWAWDGDFTPGLNRVEDGSDPDAVKRILASAGLYDASWIAYEQGGSYVSPIDGQTYTALAATSRRFADFVSVHSVRDDLAATDAQFGHAVLIPLVQGWMDTFTSGLVDPGPPVVPGPAYDPKAVGAINSALALEDAQGQRLTAVAAGNRAIIGLAPIP